MSKSYLSNLRPFERRVLVAGAVVFFIVFNWVFVWPHFSDLKAVQDRMWKAQQKMKLFQTGIDEKPKYQRMVASLEGEGQAVPAEEQSHNFAVGIQSQAAQSHIAITQMGRMTSRTNQFFIEQSLSINVLGGEGQIVDFLYNLGAGNSLIRVRGLSLAPDQSHQQLSGNVTLIASYQKKIPARRGTTASTRSPDLTSRSPTTLSVK